MSVLLYLTSYLVCTSLWLATLAHPRYDIIRDRDSLALQHGKQVCNSKFPILWESVTYSGCNRNMLKGTTTSVETCQSGWLTMYNTTSTQQTGLFDAKIHVNSPSGDIYHFLCTFTKDAMHTATCTLTYEEPARKQGPGLVTIRFRDVHVASPARGLPEGSCIADSATIVGNYFYDSEMVAAGVYSFYVPANTSPKTNALHSCDDMFPILGASVTYSGCNRNMFKGTTTSVETCQNGWLTMYNTSSTQRTGLFDAKIHVNNSAGDIYHFMCTFTQDDKYTATCTLTYEEPARKQGPALVTIRFRDVHVASPARGVPEGSCIADSATIVGNYFYDSEMVSAGAYSFYVQAAVLPLMKSGTETLPNLTQMTSVDKVMI